MSAYRIINKPNCVPPAFVIQEIVTPGGYYIEWPDLYGSVDSAKTALGNVVPNAIVRVCIPWYDLGA